MDSRELRFSRAMVFAVEEINNSSELLPGIQLGYQIYDSCASVPVAVHVAFQLSNGLDPMFHTGDDCTHSGRVVAIVGESGSTPSISMSRIIGSFNIPQVRIFNFLSTEYDVCADELMVQSDALAKLVKHYGWTWIGAVHSDSDYGNNGMASFLDAAHNPLCVSVKWRKIMHCILYRSTATVVVAFVASGDMRILLEELSQEPTPARQWIGSESWVTDPDMLRFSFCSGAIGFGIQQSVIPGLREFLLDLSATEVAASPLLTEFWEDAFSCKLGKSENIHFHGTCVFAQLKKVNFSQNGYDVSFDDNGDPVAVYELVNWQKSETGLIELVTVGHYDASLPIVNYIYLKRKWEVPVSVCTDSCPPGTRKVLQKGKPICCYDCVPCPEDSPDCYPCPKEFWPNANRDTCFLKPVEFLSFSEILGIVLTVFSLIGACLAITTATVFFRHINTPIVRANNSELSFLLLFSLTLCFLCSLTFIGPPSEWSCMLRHTAFGITFVLCISCVLGKTIVVLMAFKATLPGSNVMKWFGPTQQRMTVVSFTFIQVLICTIWLVLSPPFPIKNLTIYKEKVILECDLGSAIGFWGVLGYIGLLAVFCFVLAVLARKLPDNFNEAKLITFSMLIFCAVWIAFIPAYVSSPGKFTVAVEIFAILASSFGLIVCIFAPKCYIILFRPEKNTKKYLMNKNQD
uniref:G-protein coupled receptors family 3 profile domain-containing protein n=1 Tax=Salarias fasciatus TaxID=181472 RepID=A0A672GB12_SALFA